VASAIIWAIMPPIDMPSTWAREAQRIHQAHRIGGHVGQRVGRTPHPISATAPRRGCRRSRREIPPDESRDHPVGPLDHLRAEAPDQDHGRPHGIAVPRHFQPYAVRQDLRHVALRSCRVAQLRVGVAAIKSHLFNHYTQEIHSLPAQNFEFSMSSHTRPPIRPFPPLCPHAQVCSVLHRGGNRTPDIAGQAFGDNREGLSGEASKDPRMEIAAFGAWRTEAVVSARSRRIGQPCRTRASRCLRRSTPISANSVFSLQYGLGSASCEKL
jgi:hypothetical protein